MYLSGATNRPEEIDEAARRRFVKRIYIPLPDSAGRKQLLERLLGAPIATRAPSSSMTSLSSFQLDDDAAFHNGYEIGGGCDSASNNNNTNNKTSSASKHNIDNLSLELLVKKTDGFSGADIRSLCSEAAMGPIREITRCRQRDLLHVRASDVPPIQMLHFEDALEAVAPSVSPGDLKRYLDWNAQFGSFRRMI